MKFMMIFEAVDKATKTMNKILSAEKKAAASVNAGSKGAQAAAEGAAKASQKHASILSKLGSVARGAYNGIVSGAKAAGRASVTLYNRTVAGAKAAIRATIALQRRIVALGPAGFARMKHGASKAFKGVAVAAGLATVAFSASFIAAKRLVSIGSEFERFRTTLEATEGSGEKAKAGMDWIAEFSAKSGAELDDVTRAFVRLRSAGLDPTNGLLKTIGDTAAATEVPLLKSAEIFKDALSGKTGGLQKLGVTASKSKGMITYEYTNSLGKFESATVDANDRLAIQAKLMEIFNDKYSGSMEKFARTWDGMMTSLSGIGERFRLAIMNAGLFDWMKSKLQMVHDKLNDMAADGTFQAWAEYISQRMVQILETAWRFATGVYSVLKKLGGYLVVAKDYVGSWERLAVILGALAFAPMLVATAAGIVQIALGLAMLSAALIANPIVLLIAAIVAGAALIYLNWDGIVSFFSGIWDSIASGATAAWAGITGWLGFDPMALLSSGWSSVSTFISNAWTAIPSLSWDDIISVFSWSNVLTAMNWISWLSPLRWLDFIPGFSWSGIITGALDWAQYIVSFQWADYLPSFSWPEIPTLTWPTIPGLELPEMPDITGWIGAVSDKIGAGIDALASRAGAAWTKVKSAFSFSSDATLNVTDPATIQAAQAATAALKTDMQAVAGIDTGPAMARLTALEASATQVGNAVTTSVRQTQAFLTNVSFYPQGVALMDTMAAGIRARSAVVIAEIQKMAQAVRDHLPSSPAKTGPLSDIHRLKFGETIASSIRAEPMVKAMRGAAAATMAAASLSGAVSPVSAQPDAGSTVRAQVAARSQSTTIATGQTTGGIQLTYSPVLQLSGDAKSAEATFKQELSNHSRHIMTLLDEEQRKRSRSAP